MGGVMPSALNQHYKDAQKAQNHAMTRMAEELSRVKGDLLRHRIWSSQLSHRTGEQSWNIILLERQIKQACNATFWQRLRYLFTGRVMEIMGL